MKRLELPDFDDLPQVRLWTMRRIDANTRKVRWLIVMAVALAVVAFAASLGWFRVVLGVYAGLSVGFAVAFHRIAGLYESALRMVDEE